MRSSRLRVVLEILDGYQNFKESLRDIGMLGPLTTAGLAIGAYFWSSNLPPIIRAVIVLAVAANGLSILLAVNIWKQIRPIALLDDLMRPHISHVTFRISEMARDELVIRNKTFEDCTIYGPAVLAPIGSMAVIVGCEFTVETAEQMFVNTEHTRALTGVIGLDSCVFRRCRFVKIAFAGQNQLLERLKSQRTER